MAHVKVGRYKFHGSEVEVTMKGNNDFRETWAARFWGNIDKTEYYRMVGGVLNWDHIMARKTYRIELKIDFNDDSRHEALIGVAKQYARDFLASATLLQDRTRPACVLITDDTFVGMEEVSIIPESVNIHKAGDGQ
jgi:hypothetical protein